MQSCTVCSKQHLESFQRCEKCMLHVVCPSCSACGPEYTKLHECKTCHTSRVCVNCRVWTPAGPDRLSDVATDLVFMCKNCLAPVECGDCHNVVRRGDMDTHTCEPCFACQVEALRSGSVVVTSSGGTMSDDGGGDDETEPCVVDKCCVCTVFVCEDPAHSGLVGVTLMGGKHPTGKHGVRVCKACGTDCRQCGAPYPTAMMTACDGCGGTHICPVCSPTTKTCFDCSYTRKVIT